MIDLATPTRASRPTLWGLTPTELHDRFWASRGVHVVRQGERRDIPNDAEQFLLMDAEQLVLFRLRGLVDLLSWVKPDVLFVRIETQQERPYRENVITGEDGRFVRFCRTYAGLDSPSSRLVLTRNRQLAHEWSHATDVRAAWRGLRRATRHARREVADVQGHTFDRNDDESVADFVRDLMKFWRHPRTTVADVQRAEQNVWIHEAAHVDQTVRFIGPVWIGAGRRITGQRSVVGPAALWDEPAARPGTRGVDWDQIEPQQPFPYVRPVRPRRTSLYRPFKRAFDILFSLYVLLVTLPLYPLIMAAIWLEDGGPFFFAHRRETVGGKEFPCIKFRSMRKDADRIKRELALKNQADGPQFYIDRDPRVTRVGHILRKLNLDELPQFLNVLMGHMSVVGPRPSPHAENQYCPPWREARLSVRPGVTGLWQVMRTRQRGLDFQEWIKFDIEYVENLNWRLDLSIICKTFRILLSSGMPK